MGCLVACCMQLQVWLSCRVFQQGHQGATLLLLPLPCMMCSGWPGSSGMRAAVWHLALEAAWGALSGFTHCRLYKWLTQP